MGLDANTLVEFLLKDRVRLTAIVAIILRDVHAADDVFQQVVLTALEHRGQFRDAGHATSWALRTARCRAIDLARRRHATTLNDAALEALDMYWASLSPTHVPARMEALERCLAKLPAKSREMLRLRYESDLTCGQVAARLCRSVEAVYQMLSRLHRRLGECIETEVVRPEKVIAGRHTDA
jgi:RNA polymerase sigma-70 factor (ECF subfamily)